LVASVNRLWVRAWLASVVSCATTFGVLLLAAYAIEDWFNIEGGGPVFFAAFVVTLVVSVVVSGLFARVVGGPLERVSEAAHAMAQGRLSARVSLPPGATLELGRLVADFNDMAKALEHVEKERRVTTAVIAHELRTPLAILQGRLEALRDGVLSCNSAEISVLLSQTHTLSRLVEDLRTLTLSEAGHLKLEVTPTALGQALRKVAGSFASAATEKNIALQVTCQGTDLIVSADPLRLEQMLGALLDNAVRHTPSGGRIELELSETDGCAVVEVRDTGPGITPETLPFLFDHFYRAPGQKTRGSGLGLALVRALAQQQQATVEAANRVEGGAIFRLRWPPMKASNLTRHTTASSS
jgi:two-component system, OmpR family, sensor histidine kinase BaeS